MVCLYVLLLLAVKNRRKNRGSKSKKKDAWEGRLCKLPVESFLLKESVVVLV